MTDQTKPTIWVLADPKVGTSSQAIGIAEALGYGFETKKIVYSGFGALPNFILGDSLRGIDQKKSDSLDGPYPDIIIGAGRRTAPIAKHIKAQAKEQGKDCFLIQTMDPECSADDFDLVFIPQHDKPKENDTIIPTLGAPHRVTQEKLTAAADEWRDRFSNLPDPKVSVLVGGNANGKTFTPSHATELAMQATALATALDGSLLITTSRRTNSNAIEAMKAHINCPYHIYDWRNPDFPDNPYMGLLGLATTIIVTGDSVSMVSEALATSKPIFIFAPDELVIPKFKKFHKTLYDKGYAKRLGSSLRLWDYQDPDVMKQITETINTRLQAKQLVAN